MNGCEDNRYEDTLYYRKATAVRKAVNMLFDALNSPSRWRLWIIKKIFPEIIEVAEELREEVFWK